MIKDEVVQFNGEVLIEVRGPDGKLKDSRFIRNTVMTVGKEAIADQLLAAPTLEKPGYMAVGESAAAVEESQTALTTQNGTRKALGSKTRAAKVITMVTEFTAGEHTATLKEAGVFGAATVGTMHARTTFTEIIKGAEDTLTITWKITIS